jgi:hypothetical protein
MAVASNLIARALAVGPRHGSVTMMLLQHGMGYSCMLFGLQEVALPSFPKLNAPGLQMIRPEGRRTRSVRGLLIFFDFYVLWGLATHAAAAYSHVRTLI